MLSISELIQPGEAYFIAGCLMVSQKMMMRSILFVVVAVVAKKFPKKDIHWTCILLLDLNHVVVMNWRRKKRNYLSLDDRIELLVVDQDSKG